METDLDKIQWAIDQIMMNVANVKRHPFDLQFRCPICGDSKKSLSKARGHFYIKTGIYKCFNCGVSVGIDKLLAAIKNVDPIDIKREYFAYCHGEKSKEASNNTEFIFNGNERVFNKLCCAKVIDIPEHWEEINEDCKKMLKSRRIFEAPGLSKSMKFYYDAKLRRLVIPWRNRGKIVYYQERALYKNQEPKYWFPKGLQKLIYGLDYIDTNFKNIFYLEGVLDAIWVRNGIAVGGINISSTQKELLSNYSDYNLVWLPDNPWVDASAREEINKQSKINPKKLIFEWDCNVKAKDINEYVVKNNKIDLFYNKEFLEKHIISIARMNLKLQLKR